MHGFNASNLMRPSGRELNQLRPVSFDCHYTKHAEGSVLVRFGDTKVLCNASVDKRVPRFLKGKGCGWLTAEYGMLPRSTNERMGREAKSRQSGRTQEIQRLIGRSLRAAVDLNSLGEHTITIDCDVLQADGGTRTAAISGGFVALSLAVQKMLAKRQIAKNPVYGQIAAISVGIFNALPVLDLDYAEDCIAETDMNVVMNDAGAFIEIQGTAEGHAFRKDEMDAMLEFAQQGIAVLLEKQTAALANA